MSGDIEEKLKEAVENETPDMLDSLLSEINGMENKADTAPVPVFEEKRKRKAGMIKMLAALAAVLVVFVGARSVLRGANETFAVVGIDVNPSIELSVNKAERVTGAKALNAEAEEIIGGMKLEGSDVNTAVSAIIGAMLTNGYITDKSNSMLISVRAKDSAKGKELEHGISEKMNRFFENSEVAAAIIGQYVEDDKELEQFAEKNGISEGKAFLIKKLLRSGKSRMTEESLLSLSTQELILLAQERDIPKEDSYGEADTSRYIGRNKALAAALKKAGLSKDQIKGSRIEFDCDDGMIIYEVEFSCNGVEYEYDVDAVTGKILASEGEAEYDRDDDDDDDDDDGDDDDDDDDDD